MKCRMPGSSIFHATSSKKRWRNTIQARSTSRGPSDAISQSSTATGSNPSNIMLPMRESPQLSTVSPSSAGQLSSSQSKARSMSGDPCWSATTHS